MIWTKRIFCALVLFLNAAPFTQAADLSPSILRFHFIGANHLVSDTNATKLKQMANLPAAAVAQSNILGKVSAAAAQLFSLPSTTNEALTNRALLQPLLHDLLQFESILELHGNERPGLNLALQLDKTRSAVWSSTLATLCRVKEEKKDSWSAQLVPGEMLHFARKDEWTVVTIGSDAAHEAFVVDLRKKESSLHKNSWLEGRINWIRLEKAFGISIPFKFSETQIAVTGKADNLYTTIQMRFPEKFDWKAEPWHVPGIIHDPVVSFTAAQPIAAFCNSSKLIDQIGFNPLARQFYFWAQPILPFQTFGAVSSRDATNEIRAFGPKLSAAANPLLSQRDSGQLVWNNSASQVIWTNARIMSPSIRTASDTSGQFIVAGLFPNPEQKSPGPKQLIDHVTTSPKLIYYDWEVTENRLNHWDMLARMLPVFSPETLPNANATSPIRRSPPSATRVWMRAISRMLGNTVTEISVTGPDELTFKRKSQSGFTGMELIYLATLSDEKDFPLFGHKWQGTASSTTK